MQYNTALGFVVCGLGLLLAQIRNIKGAKVFGSIGLAIGLLTLIENFFGLDLKIDQLFMDHYITVATSHPGRMAPNTALCFFLTSVAILFSTKKIQKN